MTEPQGILCSSRGTAHCEAGGNEADRRSGCAPLLTCVPQGPLHFTYKKISEF